MTQFMKETWTRHFLINGVLAPDKNFDITHDILRCICFAKSLFKDQNAPIWRIGNLRVKMKKFLAVLTILPMSKPVAIIALIVKVSKIFEISVGAPSDLLI